jgi:hypothetical protein
VTDAPAPRELDFRFATLRRALVRWVVAVVAILVARVVVDSVEDLTSLGTIRLDIFNPSINGWPVLGEHLMSAGYGALGIVPLAWIEDAARARPTPRRDAIAFLATITLAWPLVTFGRAQYEYVALVAQSGDYRQGFTDVLQFRMFLSPHAQLITITPWLIVAASVSAARLRRITPARIALSVMLTTVLCVCLFLETLTVAERTRLFVTAFFAVTALALVPALSLADRLDRKLGALSAAD